MGTTIVKEATTSITIITIMVDSEKEMETMDISGVMDTLLPTTMDITIQILHPRRISATSLATFARNKGTIQLNVLKRRL